jgi:hypothetical protein
MKKPTTRKKPMTLENFAAAIQRDFSTLRDDMTAGFSTIRAEMTSMRDKMATHAALREVRDDVQRLNDIMVSKADLAETIRRELDTSPYAKETDVKDLRERLLHIEEKLGLKPTHRAA